MRHVEALAEELLHQGHEVALIAPYDVDSRQARVLHRGARPEPRPMPDYLVPIGRSFALSMNGAVSNISGPSVVPAVSKALRAGRFDVVHVHEPNAPVVSWYAAEAARASRGRAPSTPIRRTGSPAALTANVAGMRRLYSKLSARIAVSEAARWTAERYYGGRYRVIPNGVDLTLARPAHGDTTARCTCCSWAAPRSGRGCRCCCAPSRRCAARA